MSRHRRILPGIFALLLAAALWLPSLHWFYSDNVDEFYLADGVPSKAQQLVDRQFHLWTDPELKSRILGDMRKSNAEWDFMGRSFLVWSLANMALREPKLKPQCLNVIDQIIEETLKLEEREGIYHFLMPYAKVRPFVLKPARSQFLDGEIALMLAARRIIEEKGEYRILMQERVNVMVERMKQSPVLSAESYPDECWTFCNAVSLAAIRLSDYLDSGNNHSEFLGQWVTTARQKLLHPETKLLISSYTIDGDPIDGPEGTTIWLVAHCLQIVDEEFANDQYKRAKKELERSFLGFGFSREWPVAWKGPRDIDSGAVIPVLEISAGASGLAFIGAAAFQDTEFLASLVASLEFAGFPTQKEGGLIYSASNQVGDAVLLYSTVLGPIWNLVKEQTY